MTVFKRSANTCRLRIVGGFVAGSIGTGAAAADRIVYIHTPAVTAAIMTADRNACVKKTLAWINGPSSPAPPIREATAGQTIAHAFDMRGPRLAAAQEAQCMAWRGYAALPLTDTERKLFGKARDATARERWYDAFTAKDLAARIAAVRPPPIHAK